MSMYLLECTPDQEPSLNKLIQQISYELTLPQKNLHLSLLVVHRKWKSTVIAVLLHWRAPEKQWKASDCQISVQTPGSVICVPRLIYNLLQEQAKIHHHTVIPPPPLTSHSLWGLSWGLLIAFSVPHYL